MQRYVKQKEMPALVWSQETVSQYLTIRIRPVLATNDALFGASLFGKFLLTYAAILYLHTRSSLSAHLMLFEEASQFQQIVDPKCRSTCGDAIEGVTLNNVCHVGHQGFKPAAVIVVEDPILAPGELSRHQLVLRATKRMEWVRDPESTYADAGTTCI